MGDEINYILKNYNSSGNKQLLAREPYATFRQKLSQVRFSRTDRIHK